MTHLPQIAAHADAHFRIAKRERDGRTVTEVERARPRGPHRRARARCSAARPGDAAALAVGARAPRPGRGVARRAASARRLTATWPPVAAEARPRRGDRGLPGLSRRRTRPGAGHDPRPIAPTWPTSPGRRRARRWDGRARPDAAVGVPRARATRRGRRGSPALAPTSLRRRAAALKGFYRFAFGEGLIAVDVAAASTCPASPACCPTRSTSRRSTGCSRPRRSG